MNKSLEILAAAIAFASSATVSQAQRPRLTIDRIVGQPAITGTAPSRPAWSADSRWLAFLWNDRGLPARDVWLVERTATAPRRLTGASQGTPAGPDPVSEFTWMPGNRAVVFLRRGDLWRASLDGTPEERLTTDGGAKADIAVSPDARFVSFRRDGDLWLYSLTEKSTRQATQVGVKSIASQPLGTYYRPDVEIGSYVWGGPTYSWSPDSKWIAVHYVDRRQVRKTPFAYYLSEETSVNWLRRGYPGDSNEVRTLGLYDVAGGSLRLLDLPNPTEIKITNFEWSPGGQLLLDRETDTAIDRWIDIVDPATGNRREAWHSHRESRVYTDAASAWHPDGKRILFVADLENHYRLYSLMPGEPTPKPLTDPSYDVQGEPIPIADTWNVFYVANSPNPHERQVFCILADGGAATRVTSRPGTHTPFVSPDAKTVALLSSDDTTPTELYLVDAAGGATERRITNSPPAEFANFPWAKARYVTFKSRIDSFTIHARILEPPNLDRSKKYPVVFGPVYSNTVRNRWNGQNGLLQELMVLEKGYVVVQVDVRGSTGYGRAFREKFLMDWGGGDLDDLQSAVEYLKTIPYIDTDRAGIWGSSYGGTLTVYALLKKPGLFKAGVAGAPATDPHFFGVDDVAITRRPGDHPDTFKRGALQYAGNLKDHLLIIHGMEDDVVPFKTSVVLAEEFMKQGKDFDFAFAPAATHGWSQRDYYARYLYGKLVDYFDRFIGPSRSPGT